MLLRRVAFFEELGIFDVWVEPILPGIKTGCEAERRQQAKDRNACNRDRLRFDGCYDGVTDAERVDRAAPKVTCFPVSEAI